MDRSLDAEIANEIVDRMQESLWVCDPDGEKVCPLENYVDWINLVAIIRKMR